MARSLRQLTVPELRTKAAYRAVEKLLEKNVENDAALWSVARVMSAQEFEQAAEERSLGGVCGNPMCAQPVESPDRHGKYHIDAAAQKVFSLEDGPTYCGQECAAATRTFAVRLGSDAQALRRFERLWDQMQQRKAESAHARTTLAATAVSTAAADMDAVSVALATASSGPAATDAAAKPKSVLKKKSTSVFAAGNSAAPIMLSEVKECAPVAAGVGKKPKAARGAQAVEGYLPRARSNFKVAAEIPASSDSALGRRVRFEDEGIGAVPATAAAPANQSSPAVVAAQTQPDIEAEAALPPVPSNPVIVFDLEDAEGPLEGGKQGLAAQFGRLRVAGASEVPVAHAPSSSLLQQLGDGGMALPALPVVDEILAQRLRQGVARLFPALAATLPPELAAQLEDSASEAASTDTEAEGWEGMDSTSEEEEGGPRRLHLSFFTELYMHLDAWATTETMELVGLGPGAAAPAGGGAAVPEILAALSRLLHAALPALLAQLEAGGARLVAERRLDELLRTLRLAGPLPAFRAAHWQVVALVMLKALSLERAPALRSVLETREGLARVGKVLAAAAFTVEEFYAVLELLVPPELTK